MATILVGSLRERTAGLVGFGRSTSAGLAAFLVLVFEAIFIFLMRSSAISSMWAEAASRGLATKSRAPSARALNVAVAPSVLSALTMMTGTRYFLVIWRSVSM